MFDNPAFNRRSNAYSSGRLLHALGNLRRAQRRMDESFDFHSRSLRSFEGALGKNHHRYADLCYIVAEHHARLGDLGASL